MADYKGDSDNNINNVNEEVNYSEDNNKDSTQYVIVAYLSNKSFIYLLTTQNTPLLNEGNTAQHFILDRYAEMVF